MFIYDSVKKEKLPFESLEKKKARIYVCGPTVYDDSHLGHAKSAIVFDLLRRVLKANNYKVTFVKNFTDIDDKILKKMQESGKSLEEITSFYTRRYLDEMAQLNVEPADIEPKATETITEMINMIELLMKQGNAYQISNNDIYFSVKTDKNYLSISKRQSEDNQNRIANVVEKKDEADFALWKHANSDEVGFDAPFGRGRPGWHLECSCMIDKHLALKSEESAYSIDIHGGGADLLFPHHENEAAQSRCATNKELAKYWMHNGFVNINGEKMSKSLGNSFFLKDALKAYHGEVLRFYMLSTHYRQNMNFNEEDLLATKKRLDKLYRLKKRLYKVKGSTVNKNFKQNFLEALSDDLNVSKALAFMDEFFSEANERLDANTKDKASKKEISASIEYINEVLGVGEQDAYAYFQFGMSEEEKNTITTLIEKRNLAKKEKDFANADALRDELTALGISIMDTPEGTVWEKN